MPSRAEEVLDFWFGREGEPGEFRDEWFRKDTEFDVRVTDHFANLYEEAAAGNLDGWCDDARGCLALVIVLDQFPRNMFRGDGSTHAADEVAPESSRYAVERALDREDQRRSVELFGLLAEGPGAPDVTSYAAAHRNEILGRETTPEEAEFLKTEGSSF